MFAQTFLQTCFGAPGIGPKTEEHGASYGSDSCLKWRIIPVFDNNAAPLRRVRQTKYNKRSRLFIHARKKTNLHEEKKEDENAVR